LFPWTRNLTIIA